MAQQTAVEWYYQQTIIEGKTNYWELFEQAKQMENDKYLMFNDFLDTEKTLGISDKKTIERIQWYFNQYHNETYNEQQ